MKLIVLLFSILVWVGWNSAVLGASVLIDPPESTAESLQMAQVSYENGQYAGAERILSVLLRDYPYHPGLLMNQGLVYSAEGQLGKSIALLTRASVLAPQTPGLSQVLSTAQGRVIRQFSPNTPWFDRFGAQYRRLLSLNGWTLLGAIGINLLIWAWIIRQFRGTSRWIQGVGLSGLTLLLFAVAPAWSGAHTLWGQRKGIVVVNKVAVRSGPSTQHHTKIFVHDGESFDITHRKDGWVRIRLRSGISGWIEDSGTWSL